MQEGGSLPAAGVSWGVGGVPCPTHQPAVPYIAPSHRRKSGIGPRVTNVGPTRCRTMEWADCPGLACPGHPHNETHLVGWEREMRRVSYSGTLEMMPSGCFGGDGCGEILSPHARRDGANPTVGSGGWCRGGDALGVRPGVFVGPASQGTDLALFHVSVFPPPFVLWAASWPTQVLKSKSREQGTASNGVPLGQRLQAACMLGASGRSGMRACLPQPHLLRPARPPRPSAAGHSGHATHTTPHACTHVDALHAAPCVIRTVHVRVGTHGCPDPCLRGCGCHIGPAALHVHYPADKASLFRASTSIFVVVTFASAWWWLHGTLAHWRCRATSSPGDLQRPTLLR